jgi:hypothetical protein
MVQVLSIRAPAPRDNRNWSSTLPSVTTMVGAVKAPSREPQAAKSLKKREKRHRLVCARIRRSFHT